MSKHLKKSKCRHRKYAPRIEVKNTKHKIFCSRCNKLLKIVHPEDSPAKVRTWPHDY